MNIINKIKWGYVFFVTALSYNQLHAQQKVHNGPIYENAKLPNTVRIDDLLSRLSTDQKINLLVGSGMAGFDMISGFEKLNPVKDAQRFMVPGAAGSTVPIEQYKLPAVIMTDGPAGVRINPKRQGSSDDFYATRYPIGSLLASTWNEVLIQAVGAAIGNEALEYGSDIQLGPAINIMRNPLCGRNYEYYSEDPLIAGKIGAAYTRGLQKNGVGVSVKHFAANNSEKNRVLLNVHASPRTLREIYLRAFEIIVKEADPKTIMSSYNKLNGQYTSSYYDLLTTVLRDEWGYKGLLMTDWFGGEYGKNINALFFGTGGMEVDPNRDNTTYQIKAGNDLLMPGTIPQIEKIKADLASGIISEEEIDRCVKRVLNMVLDSPKMQRYVPSGKIDHNGHSLLARESASEGMVLLENNSSTLPLSLKNIGLFGSLSYQFVAGGTGSGSVNSAYTVSLVEGLKNSGYIVDNEIAEVHKNFLNKENTKLKEMLKKQPFMLIPLMAQPKLKESEIKKSALSNDVAIITIGRSSGEFEDRPLEGDYLLTNEEKQLINKVSEIYHAQGKKVIVVLNIGAIIEIESWKDKVDAVLLAWLPGQEGGNAVAEILSGKVNPSGKLTMTIPVKYEDLSTSDNFQGTPADNPMDVSYKEGIYIGYRYFDTFKVKPAYEFGFGLSYTNFDFDKIKISEPVFNNEIFVSIDVTNTGTKAGKEVVQLYLSAPNQSIDKPLKELKAFKKTKLLQPGETQTVFFRLSPKDLASFYEGKNEWIADKGTYKVQIGNSSRNIRQQVNFDLKTEQVVEKANNVLYSDIDIKTLKP